MLDLRAMNIPPADLGYLRDQFSDLATQIGEHWESAAVADADDSPFLSREAMNQLMDMLSLIESGRPSSSAPKQAEIHTLGEYGLHLIEDLSDKARELGQVELASETECLSLPFALWIARHDGEIRNLAPVVNALAHYANSVSEPRVMSALYTCCCEVIDAASPACEDQRQRDGRQPWALLLLNRAIVATRSLNPELMVAAFDAIVEQLPEQAQRFFVEGMEQMAIIDYPDHVREVMQHYYSINASPRRLH